jgi:hypothetical protein
VRSLPALLVCRVRDPGDPPSVLRACFPGGGTGGGRSARGQSWPTDRAPNVRVQTAGAPAPSGGRPAPFPLRPAGLAYLDGRTCRTSSGSLRHHRRPAIACPRFHRDPRRSRQANAHPSHPSRFFRVIEGVPGTTVGRSQPGQHSPDATGIPVTDGRSGRLLQPLRVIWDPVPHAAPAAPFAMAVTSGILCPARLSPPRGPAGRYRAR